MSNVKHKIEVGNLRVVDFDGFWVGPLSPQFTFDRDTITFDSNIRRFDET